MRQPKIRAGMSTPDLALVAKTVSERTPYTFDQLMQLAVEIRARKDAVAGIDAEVKRAVRRARPRVRAQLEAGIDLRDWR